MTRHTLPVALRAESARHGGHDRSHRCHDSSQEGEGERPNPLPTASVALPERNSDCHKRDSAEPQAQGVHLPDATGADLVAA